MHLETIPTIWPDIRADVIQTQYGPAIRLIGKGAKGVANQLARENYLNGTVDTKWQDVRHGLGYLVPLFDNPVTALI